MNKQFSVIVSSFLLAFTVGLVNAQIPHPSNSNIVGAVTTEYADEVCFNNDGDVSSETECAGGAFDEGDVIITNDNWRGRDGGSSGINGCGVSAVNPVSIASCPQTNAVFAACSNDGYVLVQTTKSGHYFALKADGFCSDLATPESAAITPCLLTDFFDPDTGCTAAIVDAPGQTITDFTITPVDDPSAPGGVTFPFGKISYTVTSPSGGLVTVTHTFSTDLPANFILYKVDGSIYTPIPEGLNADPDGFWIKTGPREIQITLRDGGKFDLDDTVNSSITDPIALAVPLAVPQISVIGGFIKLDTTGGVSPNTADCTIPEKHHGRMVIDELNDTLYICTSSGWNPFN